MHTTAEGMVSRGDGWRAVELSYSGASMTIILPDSGRLAGVERQLDADFLASIDAHQSFDLVHLSLPRWSSTTAVDLIPHLKALGIRDLFDRDAADLRGIADAQLSVSLVVHQATISVDEHGTEAAAATAVGGGTTGGGPDRETTIRVDRPFIYLIHDEASGEILFMGRVLDPSKG
jgi:serpin B